MTNGVRKGDGYRKLKYVFSAIEMQHRRIPENHIRNDVVGISGSSVFDTDARTSGYGESSSSSSSAPTSVYLSEVPMSSTDVLGSDDIRCFTPGDGGAYEDEKDTPVDGRVTLTSRESADRVSGLFAGVGKAVVDAGLKGMGRMLYELGPASASKLEDVCGRSFI
jgi:hypothetical protein